MKIYHNFNFHLNQSRNNQVSFIIRIYNCTNIGVEYNQVFIYAEFNSSACSEILISI